MSDSVQIALIVNLGAIAVALINRGGWRRVETKVDALAKHLGLKVEDSGKVVKLEPVDARAAYADKL